MAQTEGNNETMNQADDIDWQASASNVRERNAIMLNKALLADVNFIVGPGPAQRRIPAHKNMLVAGSSVFYAMFCGGLPEDKNEVMIPDVEPDAFRNLLKWVHVSTNLFESYSVIFSTMSSWKKKNETKHIIGKYICWYCYVFNGKRVWIR